MRAHVVAAEAAVLVRCTVVLPPAVDHRPLFLALVALLDKPVLVLLFLVPLPPLALCRIVFAALLLMLADFLVAAALVVLVDLVVVRVLAASAAALGIAVAV